MRPDRLYLVDIVAAADAIGRFIADINDEGSFYTNELRQSAILQKADCHRRSYLAPEFGNPLKYSEVEWTDIAGFRNIAVHAYFSMKWEIVWVTATEDVPQLREQVARILAELPKE